ncbi:MAG TPA: ankyrin repeat domain-containing protein, partial [Aggregatilineales bacterium]|nr:ankyrin repeat domain-containing protein [Aggregatilineales bacterium]
TLADSRFSELLIKAGGVVNEVYQNRSLLMHCIELIDPEERYKQVGMFLWGGADVDFVNSHGWTAWMMARHYHFLDGRLLKLLEDAGAKSTDIRQYQIFHHIKSLSSDPIPQELEKYKNANVADPFGKTPLIHAVRQKKPDIVKLLLDAGAEPDWLDDGHSNALMWAVYMNDLDSFRLLLPISRIFETEGHVSALVLACQHQYPIVKDLIQAGANVNATNSLGQTPAMWAMATGNVENILSLYEAGANFTIEPVFQGGDEEKNQALMDLFALYAHALRTPLDNTHSDEPIRMRVARRLYQVIREQLSQQQLPLDESVDLRVLKSEFTQ